MKQQSKRTRSTAEIVDAVNEGTILRERHRHSQRALTQIRTHARKAIAAWQRVTTILNTIESLALENDARELKKRPSLKYKRVGDIPTSGAEERRRRERKTKKSRR